VHNWDHSACAQRERSLGKDDEGVECEIIKARNWNSAFLRVVWPALGIRPRTMSWVSGGSQYHGF
jgi:hypothetical protein